MKKFRKAIAVLLAVLLCVSAVPASVWAEAAQTTQEQIIQDESKTEQMEDEQFKNKTAVDKEDQEKDSGVNSDVGTERNENVQTEAVTDVKEDQKEKNINLKKAASFAGGDGSVENPYQISTAEQLDAVRNDLLASYVLVNDIDLSGFESWEPIGEYSYNDETVQFRGNFNGNNYKISNLKIIHDNVNAGLFGSIYDTYNIQIKNIYIENANIEGNFKYAGVLCGVINRDFTNAESTVSIENCTASGEINGINTTMTGGLIGYAGQSKILNCKSYVNINGQGESVCVGGIIGGSDYQQAIQNCVNYGNISYESNGSMHIGGIAGNGYKVENSYNIGNLTAIQSEKANLSEFLFGGIQGGFGSFGPDGNVSNRYYSLKNCQNAAEEINAFQRKNNLELVSLDNIAFRIINSSVGERMKINNNISWSKTKINGNEVSADNPEVGPDKKHGKSVEASELDEAIRPEEPVENKGFDLKRDGWPIINSFEGFGHEKGYRIPLNTYLDTFVCFNSLLLPLIERIFPWGGNCFGMSITSAMNYEGINTLDGYFKNTNGKSLNQYGYQSIVKDFENRDVLTLKDNNSVIEYIEKMQLSQLSPDILLNARVFNHFNYNGTNGYKKTFEDLIDYLDHNKDPLIICFNKHAMVINTAIPYKKITNGEYNGWLEIMLYDPNSPSLPIELKNPDPITNYAGSRKLLINPNTGEWRYINIEFDKNAQPEYTWITNKNSETKLSLYDPKKISNITKTKLSLISDINQILLFNTDNLATETNGKEVFKVEKNKPTLLDDNCDYEEFSDGNSEKASGMVRIPKESKLKFFSKNSNNMLITGNDNILGLSSTSALYTEVDTIKNSISLNSKENNDLDIVLNSTDSLEEYKSIRLIGKLDKDKLLSLALSSNDVFTINSNVENPIFDVVIESNNMDEPKKYANVNLNDLNGKNIIEYVNEVKKIPVTDVTISSLSEKLQIGDQLTLTPTITPDNATEKAVTWTSSSDKIATVDENGLVTAVAEGKATITVTTKDGNKTAACEVTVTKREDPSKPEEPSNPTTPTVNPNDGQGTTTTGQLKPDTTNQGSNPLTGMTLQEKINTMIIWLAAAALCAAVVLFVKRKQKR